VKEPGRKTSLGGGGLRQNFPNHKAKKGGVQQKRGSKTTLGKGGEGGSETHQKTDYTQEKRIDRVGKKKS